MPRNSPEQQAVGVFDSGIGGLTVVKELMRQLPREHVVYFGDTARVPYGTKSRESVVRFSKECIAALLRYNVKAVVVACNTSSAHALPVLKRMFPVPVIGVIVPGVKKAVAASQRKKIGILATPSTVQSRAYMREIRRRAPKVKVLSTPCPLFVPLAEEGWGKKKVTETVAGEYLRTVKRSGADTVILGCTHYPLLKTVIQRVLGPKVTLVDSAREVAAEVKELLSQRELLRESGTPPRRTFLVSDEPKHFREMARRFLGNEVKNVRRCRYV